MKPLVICGVTHQTGARFVKGQLHAISRHGYRVVLVSPEGPIVESVLGEGGALHVHVDLVRTIAPVSDLRCVWRLYQVFRRLRPDIVNFGTPKAGLLGMTAAWAAGVPVRVYTLRGLRHDTSRGAIRRILFAMEWLTCRLSTRVLCISPSLRREVNRRGLARTSKTDVIGRGSSNGINLEYFHETPELRVRAEEIGRELGFEGARVVAFAGRMVRSKGVDLLLRAFEQLRRDERYRDVRLLLVGARENQGEPLPASFFATVEEDPAAAWVGEVEDVRPYLLLADVLAVPTLREGFGNVFLEAAAMGRPVIGTDIVGVVDSVARDETGLLIEPENVDDLITALQRYLDDPALRERHGKAGLRRAKEFDSARFWPELARYYRGLLEASRREGSKAETRKRRNAEI